MAIIEKMYNRTEADFPFVCRGTHPTYTISTIFPTTLFSYMYIPKQYKSQKLDKTNGKYT